MEALEDEADLAAVADLLLAREACHFPLPHAHAACVGTIHGADHVEQSVFSRAGWACDRHQSARGDNEIDAVESRHARAARAVALREAGDLDARTAVGLQSFDRQCTLWRHGPMQSKLSQSSRQVRD